MQQPKMKTSNKHTRLMFKLTVHFKTSTFKDLARQLLHFKVCNLARHDVLTYDGNVPSSANQQHDNSLFIDQCLVSKASYRLALSCDCYSNVR